METLNVPYKPWEYMTYTVHRTITRNSQTRGKIYVTDYDAQFETLRNYNRSYWKPGDVVKFGNGFIPFANRRWESWFLDEKAKDDFMKRNHFVNKRIPVYARNQYAIILARYKWTKFKGYANYRDYGTILMMLTGDKIGHIRKYYTTSPYDEIGKYPYTKMKYNLNHEKLFHGVDRGDKVEVFLENLMEKIAYGHCRFNCSLP